MLKEFFNKNKYKIINEGIIILIILKGEKYLLFYSKLKSFKNASRALFTSPRYFISLFFASI